MLLELSRTNERDTWHITQEVSDQEIGPGMKTLQLGNELWSWWSIQFAEMNWVESQQKMDLVRNQGDKHSFWATSCCSYKSIEVGMMHHFDYM